jgi:hypothetical protein
LAIAKTIAVTDLIAVLIIDHSPWNKPNVKNDTMIRHGTPQRRLAQPLALLNRSQSLSRLHPKRRSRKSELIVATTDRMQGWSRKRWPQPKRGKSDQSEIAG